jgi:hypothetical protein
MRAKILKLTLALIILAGTGAGVLSSPTRAEAACYKYCCPDLPTRCTTCCSPRCDLNCP